MYARNSTDFGVLNRSVTTPSFIIQHISSDDVSYTKRFAVQILLLTKHRKTAFMEK